eukprot:TRINITY_DN5592_c2_g1_i1.p1 TRINITY_DN5592_c2_g1~~TRINITY_DN5592_c2_g1_i1.p1  ORF type:complete len:346 (-),score=60.95 TRINITY_DN5592_c2_g1_i1:76-1113(-)
MSMPKADRGDRDDGARYDDGGGGGGGGRANPSSSSSSITNMASVYHVLRTQCTSTRVDIASSMCTGICIAGLLNPWDKALYLSIVEDRKFIHRLNFHRPFQGLASSILHRTFSGGLYFFLQGRVERAMDNRGVLMNADGEGRETNYSRSLAVGVVAGTTNGIILNQLSTVKHHNWGKSGPSFWWACAHMWKHGGHRPFFKGITCTGTRDLLFGCTYESLRRVFKHAVSTRNNDVNPSDLVVFLCNFMAASTGTLISSPLNYARNIQYASSVKAKAPRGWDILRELWQDSQREATWRGRLRFLHNRLRVGWGTARVGTGMALGQMIYDFSRNSLSKKCNLVPGEGR